MFSGMDASLKLCISDSPTLVCSTRGVGWLGEGSASMAVAKDPLVSRAKAGVRAWYEYGGSRTRYSEGTKRSQGFKHHNWPVLFIVFGWGACTSL